MKIAWFHSHLLHVNSGGTRLVLDYCQALQDFFGHDITLFCDIASKETAHQLGKTRINLCELDTLSTNNPFYWLTLPLRQKRRIKELEHALQGYDFIINSMFPMNCLVANLPLPRLQFCYEPFAFFYDPGFLKNFTLSQQLFFRIAKLFYSGADKSATRKMDAILTVNKTNIQKIQDIYNLTPQVVYAGIDTQLYHRVSERETTVIRQQYKGTPLLFHSSDLTGIKGTFPLLNVIKELSKIYPEVKLLITVYVKNAQGIELLKSKIKELHLESNVEYIGCLEKQELPKYYSAVDFVCQPGINQPANWPLKEALLCGTPIIGGKESEEPIDFINGISVDINNQVESANKISQLYKRKSKLYIETSELVRNYSKESCISSLNGIILQTYENYRNKY